MEEFIPAEDYELWVSITKGPLNPTITDSEGNNVPTPTNTYNEGDYKMLGKNAKAKYILVCGLGPDELNRISSCTSAKQIWDTYKTLMKVQLKSKNSRFLDCAMNTKPLR